MTSPTSPGSELGEEMIHHLIQLVAFQTESGASNEALIDYCAELAEQAGAEVRRVTGPAEGLSNLYLRLGPAEAGGLLLSGHTDVVPAGSSWATDPYQLTAAEGLLWGRGTADMKGFIAVALAIAASTDQRRLSAPLHLALSCEEEVGCAGVGSLLDELAALPTCDPDLVIVGEPTSMRIGLAHTGKVGYRVAVEACSGHSSRAGREPSAIFSAAELCRIIGSLNRPGAKDGPVPFVSANVGTIAGGTSLNVLARSCELTFEVRFDADGSPARILAPVWAETDRIRTELAKVGGSVELIELVDYPALCTDPSDPAVGKLVAETGRELTTVDFGCEAGLYARTLEAPTVVLGPGDIADAHRPNEHIDPAQLLLCAEVLARAVDVFCITGLGCR